MKQKQMSEEEQKAGLSRRNFLKGAAVGVSGIATMGILSACSRSGDAEKTAAAVDVMTYEKSQSLKWNFEIPPKPITDIASEETADIIVIGSGMAGLTTACSAAENGAKVILISGSSKPISRGGSNQAANSRVMKKYGVEPLNAPKLFKREYMAHTYHVDQSKWAKFYNRSEEAMNWLIDKVESKGIEVILERDNTDELGPSYAHGFVLPNAKKGEMVMSGQQGAVETLEAFAKNAGATIYYNTVAKQLVRDDNNKGRVSAVIAEKNGKFIKYKGAKGIVLATGDFSADKEMLAKYCSWILPLASKETAKTDYNIGFSMTGIYKGDGQKMGLWVGAAWQKTVPNAPMIHGGMGGGYEPIGSHTGLVVNPRGKRFYNEDCSAPYSATHLLSQADNGYCGIWGKNYAQALVKSGREFHTFGQTYTDPAWTPEEIIQKWEDGIEGGAYFKADTIEQLCEVMGLPVAETVASVKRYNELCKAGEDKDFYKDASLMIPVETGPFYGSKGKATFMTIMGGLRTDANMQVCDEKDTPIPGLFNVGQMVGDMYANIYNFAIPGHSLGGNCLTFGYVLGKDLAKDAIAGNKTI
ncbi:MAG TPA: FAD-dependent oxidoreductase [Negativicutes bacterium]|jgi:succinate dehydrogenase/fumarate reductase flavoprotein subunit